jgi:S1-C subfamily serine protease
MSLPQIIEKTMPSVVAIGTRIEVTQADKPPSFPLIIGTGFVVDENGLIATNDHVLKELYKWPKQSRFVAFFHHAPLSNGGVFVGVAFRNVVSSFELSSFSHTGRFFGDSTPDIAFSVVDIRGLPAMKINGRDNALQIGAEVISIGFPQGRDTLSPHGGDVPSQLHPFVRRGIVSSVLPCPSPLPHGFTVDVLTEGGASGSPICSAENGEVLGILYGSFHLLQESLMTVRNQWEPNLDVPSLSEIFEADISKAGNNPTESPMTWDHLGQFEVIPKKT